MPLVIIERETSMPAPLDMDDDRFPEYVYVLLCPRTDRYGCYCYQGVHGLACFSEEQGARSFSELIDFRGFSFPGVSFDDAREIAKSRPLPVVAMHLLDDIRNPRTHYIR